MNTVLTVEVVKGVFCEWPRLENDDSLMVAGSYRPLEDAYRIAHTQIIQWLARDTGLSIMDTYQLVSQAARSRIANVCDANYTVVAKVPNGWSVISNGREQPSTTERGARGRATVHSR